MSPIQYALTADVRLATASRRVPRRMVKVGQPRL